MENFTAILEFALIIALGGVWWMARRDLLALVTHQQTPMLREMERVQASIELLLERLEAQMEDAERRMAASMAGSRPSDAAPRQEPLQDRVHPGLIPVSEQAADLGALASGETAASDRYDEVFRLLDAGLDPDEVARRTGLGSGEVRLVASLRPNA